MSARTDGNWLLIFYTVPSKPVSNRVKLWRKLAKAGAVQIKGAVYILPDSNDHYELFQWIVTEVASMGGEAAFVKTPFIETITEREIIALFNNAREREYREIEKKLETLDRKVQSVKKGSRSAQFSTFRDQAVKLDRSWRAVRGVDFFSSNMGESLGKRLKELDVEIRSISGDLRKDTAVQVVPKQSRDYHGRLWVTRKNPFVDRMASAWLIRRFIDREARFGFVDEPSAESRGNDIVSFDIRDGEFTHQGNLCTFEVLMRAFGIRDKAVKDIAEIVHDMDIRDDTYEAPDAAGVEKILAGIRKTAKSDIDALERGMAVFEMLYEAKK